MQEAPAPSTASFRCPWHAGKAGLARSLLLPSRLFCLSSLATRLEYACAEDSSRMGGGEPVFLGSLYLSVNTQHMWTWHGTAAPRATEFNCASHTLRTALFIFHECYFQLHTSEPVSLAIDSLVARNVTGPTYFSVSPLLGN